MSVSLNDILRDPVSSENEQLIFELARRKVKGAAGLSVRLLRAMEAQFGP